MDIFKDSIEKIMTAFVRQELGNKLSEFAAVGLRGMVLGEVEKLEKRLNKPKEKKNG